MSNAAAPAATPSAPPPAPEVQASIGQPDGTIASGDPLHLTFSQPMDQSSVLQALTLAPAVAGTAAWQGDTFTYTPADAWPDATLVSLTLAPSAKSAGGQPMPQPFTWGFVTEPNFAALEVSPRRNATYVPPDAVINVIFSHAPDLATLQSRWHVAPAVGGKLQVDGRIATFVPTKPLPLDTAFTVTLDAGVKDSEGRTLAEGMSWQFTTVPQSTQPPKRVFAIGGKAVFAPLSGAHQIAFNGYGVASVHLRLFRVPSVDAFLPAYTAKVSGGKVPVVDTSGFTALTEWDAELPDPASEGIKLVDVPETERAGLYYIDESSLGGQPSGQFLVVSGQGLLVKQAWNGVFVWATTLADGSPRADLPVQVYDADDGKLLQTGTTATDGTYAAPLDLPALPNDAGPANLLVVAGSGADLTIGGSANEFFSDGFLGFPVNYQSYVYTDRPIYRPGDIIHLRGIIRRDDDVHYAMPGNVTFQLRLTGPQNGTRILERAITPDAAGAFALDMPLDSNAPTGFYSYLFGTGGGQQLQNATYGSFEVEAYRKPQYAVQVSIPDQAWVSGDTLPVTVTARYYFDQAVQGAQVQVRVTRLPWFDSGLPPPATDPEASENGSYGGGAYGEEVLTRQGTLDATGSVTFPVPADLGTLTDSQRYMVEATVTDMANLPVSATATTIVHRGALTLDIQPKSYAVTVAAPVETTLTVHDLAGKAVPNAAVACAVVQQTYDITQEGTPKGAYPIYHLVEVPAYQFSATTGTSGTASVPVRLTRPSGYKLSCQVRDQRGNTVTRDLYLWAVSSTGVLPPYAAAGDHLSVAADRSVYAVGDVAHLQVYSPLADIPALVTVERGKVYQHQLLPLHGKTATLDLPITNDDLPNVQVSVAIQAHDQLLTGSVALRVPATSRYLNLSIKADQPRYKPGDTASFTLRATTADGKPAQGTFSLGMVDAAIYALARQTPPTIKAGFYAPRSIQVRTGASLSAAVGRLGPQRGGGGGGGGAAPESLRTNFPDTGYWSPDVHTGPDGTATVKLTMPDSLTTWRLTAIGATSETQVGDVTADVVSTLPFHVRPSFPRFLVSGDHLSLLAIIDNATDAAIPASVSLASKALTLDGAAQQQVTVPAHGSKGLRWDVRVGALGDASISLEATSAQASDAVQVTLPVVAGGSAQGDSQSGELGTTPVTAHFAVPATALPGTASLQLAIAPGLASGVLAASRYLAAYPYNCAEQTVSAFLPAILAREVDGQAGLTAQTTQLPPDLDRLVAEDLQQLYAVQHPDGGWNWWSYDQTDPYMTAYVVYGLTQAKRLGYPVVQQSLDRGLASLQEQLSSPAAGLSTRAYMLHVLALAGHPRNLQSAGTQELLSRRGELASYGQSYLAQLLQEQGDVQDAKTVLAGLRDAASQTPTTASWKEQIDLPPLRGSLIYSTAAVLDAFTALAPDDPLAVKAARFLLSSRTGTAWSSTHDSSMAAMALNRYLLAHGDFQVSGTVTVTWNGRVVKQATLKATDEPLLLELPPGSVQAQNTLQLQSNGSAGFFWSAALSSHRAAAQSSGSATLTVSRAYSLADGSPAPATLPLGTVVRVQVRVQATAPLDYVLVADHLPAGLEPLNPVLATTASPSAATSTPPAYDHMDLRDAEVDFAVTKLAAGTHTYSYDALATSSGTFQAPSAEVYQMYSPAVRAASAASTLTIGH